MTHPISFLRGAGHVHIQGQISQKRLGDFQRVIFVQRAWEAGSLAIPPVSGRIHIFDKMHVCFVQSQVVATVNVLMVLMSNRLVLVSRILTPIQVSTLAASGETET